MDWAWPLYYSPAPVFEMTCPCALNPLIFASPHAYERPWCKTQKHAKYLYSLFDPADHPHPHYWSSDCQRYPSCQTTASTKIRISLKNYINIYDAACGLAFAGTAYKIGKNSLPVTFLAFKRDTWKQKVQQGLGKEDWRSKMGPGWTDSVALDLFLLCQGHLAHSVERD